MIRSDNWKSEYVRTNSIRSAQTLEHQMKIMKKFTANMPLDEMGTSQEIHIQDRNDTESPSERSNNVVLFKDFN